VGCVVVLLVVLLLGSWTGGVLFWFGVGRGGLLVGGSCFLVFLVGFVLLGGYVVGCLGFFLDLGSWFYLGLSVFFFCLCLFFFVWCFFGVGLFCLLFVAIVITSSFFWWGFFLVAFIFGILLFFCFVLFFWWLFRAACSWGQAEGCSGAAARVPGPTKGGCFCAFWFFISCFRIHLPLMFPSSRGAHPPRFI